MTADMTTRTGGTYADTDYGFRWNGAEVTRILERDDGGVVIRVGSGSRCVDVYVSPTGRSVRAFSRGGAKLELR